ncbi:Cytoplasmic tRNA 2-thiolation protein 2 [Pleurostoma richardsiae]|uniref:Cytoplasmic tRNA 2-thiolation protein 2 n=1 Tax=Pleurostoma richardsiae TaxID=41990 RepID=A0AA38VN07_9PEZI|nr:Cytoplasmic tRNA 2-thiolation protein 2 [Pleurostoma richardsiae]
MEPDQDTAKTQPARLCRRCKEREARLKIRGDPACRECYCRYINTKVIKRLEALRREFPGSEAPRRYLVGLSFGVSSSCLVQVLDDASQNQLRKRQAVAFEPVVIHVDTDLSASESSLSSASELLGRFRERYPRFTFERIPLEAVLELDTVDWASLPTLAGGGGDQLPRERLQTLFARLPSATSRADVLRLLVRHVLVAAARRHGCDALLLGHSTTALAELTLGETAKGRGFSLAWQTGDGRVPIVRYPTPGTSSGEDSSMDERSPEANAHSLLVYYPLRETFRKELFNYAALITPPLTDLMPEEAKGKTRPVVSHKDMSIEEVMARYFEEVEESYPSVVANVVRTTTKLERLGAEGLCALCGTVLDEQGDERWAGEIGDDGGGEPGETSRARLCYGCKRSLRA